MIRALLLSFFLLIGTLAATSTPAEAARATAFARAKMHHRLYTHRPSYKFYKGGKKAKRFSLRKSVKSSKPRTSLFRSKHSTNRF